MRKAPKITLKELKDKLEPVWDEFPDSLPNAAEKDLEKVLFDWENYEYTGAGYYDGICGPKLLSNGLPVWFVNAGGDWESPIIFILYWSGKGIRAYIPDEGNTFDKEYMAAYGSQQETENWNTRYGKLPYLEQPDVADDAPAPDFKKMEECIVSRIQIS